MKRLFYFPLLLTLLVSLVSGVFPLGQGVAYASPDTERQSPDAILSQLNLSGTVADIDDDPDLPDASWMVATGNNVNTDVRTSFPTPSGSLTVGADLQEFRAQVRQFNTGQTGIPDACIELWENGALVRAGSDVPVTGSGQVISFTWNANELGTADGSLVEAKVVGTKSGGAPSARNTVDVGAIEWNVDYSVTPSITNIPDNYAFGTVAEGSTNVTGLTYFTVTNYSAFNVNITISGTDMTGGVTWTLSNDGTAGNMIYGLNAGLEGGSYNVVVRRDPTYNTLVSGLAGEGGTQKWGLQFLAPTTFTDGGSKSGTVTLTATQA